MISDLRKKINVPGIGMRIIKSALAVTLCLIVDIFRGDDGIVFYSQLAALWCMQMYRNNTLSNALQRTIGTVIGAVYGLFYLMLYKRLTIKIGDNIFVESVCIFFSIIIVIYTTVIIKKKQASYFSCVVFLSIVINHIGDAAPYRFVWNRFLDTMIGIGIGILVNNMRLCFNPDRETLFVSGVDNILVDDNNRISAFSKVELNRMIEDGLNFTISTERTPASLLEPLREIDFRYPVVVMDGAALYDVKRGEYINEYVISSDTAYKLNELFISEGFSPYTNIIIDDTLLIYYQETDDDVNNRLVESLRVSPYRNYIKREYSGEENVVYFMILDATEKVEKIYDKLVSEGYESRLKILKKESSKYGGYSYLRIYNKNASKENMLLYLKKKYNIRKMVTFGTIPGKYDVFVMDDNFNKMVKLVRRRYESWGRG